MPNLLHALHRTRRTRWTRWTRWTRPHGSRPRARLTRATLLFLLLFGTDLAQAVEITPGTVYEAGTELTSSEAGVTLTVPSGWRAALPPGSEALLMERVAGGSMIFVAAQETTEQAMLLEMSQDVDMGDGLVLVPTALPSREGGVLQGEYRLTGSSLSGLGAAFARVGPAGVGVLLLALDTGTDRGGRDAARTIARGVAFAKPKTTEAPAPTPSGAGAQSARGEGANAWQDYMRGRYVARFYSGSQYHEKEELWLCSDGTFRRSGDSGGWGGGASGAFASSGGGTWTASGQQPGVGELRLQFSDGVGTYALSLEGGKLYLDGTQWLRGANELCP